MARPAGLGWSVIKKPLAVDLGSNLPDVCRYRKLLGHYVTARQDTDEGLGVVGERYRIVQYHEAFALIDQLLGSAIHFETSSAESCEGVLRAPAGGAFSAQRCVSPTNEDTFSGSIAFLGSDALFAWTGNVPGESSNASIQGARWPDSSSLPEVARDLDLPGLPYGSPTLMNDDQGSVVALYTNQANQLRAAAFDGGPPILLSAGVPAGATEVERKPLVAEAAEIEGGALHDPRASDRSLGTFRPSSAKRFS